MHRNNQLIIIASINILQGDWTIIGYRLVDYNYWALCDLRATHQQMKTRNIKIPRGIL